MIADALVWAAVLGLVLYYGHRRGFRWGVFFKNLGWWRCVSKIEVRMVEVGLSGNFHGPTTRCRCVRRARHYGPHECIHGGEWSRYSAYHPARCE
jgi:hypothetical protein